MVEIGDRSVPLNGFHEVPIRTLSQLQYESPADSEQQQWVQCQGCRAWQHCVCAMYNARAHNEQALARVGARG